MRGYNTFANRGRDFEDFVIQVNDLYTRSGKAVVYKVPTEFLPIRDSTGQIKSCKVEHKSCVDFLGRYNGTPVAAKVEADQDHAHRFVGRPGVQEGRLVGLHRPAVPGNH